MPGSHQLEGEGQCKDFKPARKVYDIDRDVSGMAQVTQSLSSWIMYIRVGVSVHIVFCFVDPRFCFIQGHSRTKFTNDLPLKYKLIGPKEY